MISYLPVLDHLVKSRFFDLNVRGHFAKLVRITDVDFFSPKDSLCDGLKHIKNLRRAWTCKLAKNQKWHD